MRFSRAALLASGVVGGATALTAYGTRSRSSQLFGPSVYRGHGIRRSVALTFDDGPSERTPELLEFLHKEDIRATFFMCGQNVRRLPAHAGAVAAGGHQIGNHTFSHPYLPFKSKAFIEKEFAEAQRVISAETGISPMFLRAPYGFRWAGMRDIQNKLSLLGVMWTVLGNDWKWPARRIAERVVAAVSPGGIICLHDGRTTQPNPDISEMLASVRTFVPVLKDQGYTFETVSELLSY